MLACVQALTLERQRSAHRPSSSDPPIQDDGERHWRAAMESQAEPRRQSSEEGKQPEHFKAELKRLADTDMSIACSNAVAL